MAGSGETPTSPPSAPFRSHESTALMDDRWGGATQRVSRQGPSAAAAVVEESRAEQQ